MSQVQHPSTKQPTSAGDKVVVACKMPHGLSICMFRQVEETELVMGGGSRNIKRAERVGEYIKINGNATRQGEAPKHQVVAGYGITEGVDRDTWENWLSFNSDFAAVRNGLIKALPSVAQISDYAKAHREVRSGLERLDRAGDERAPKPTDRSVSEISEAERDSQAA